MRNFVPRLAARECNFLLREKVDWIYCADENSWGLAEASSLKP